MKHFRMLLIVVLNLFVSFLVLASNEYGYSYMREDIKLNNTLSLEYDDFLDETNIHSVVKSVNESLKSTETFVLKKLTIENNTKVSTDEILNLLSGQLNKNVTFNDLYTFTKIIRKIYVERGYFLSYAILPEQEIKNGEVRIVVIEGKISQYEIESKSGYSNVLNSYLNKLISKEIALYEDFSKFDTKLENLGGKSSQRIMPTKILGEYKILVKYEQQVLNGNIEYTNLVKPGLGKHRKGIYFAINTPKYAMTDSLYYTASNEGGVQRISFARFDHTQVINANGDHILATFGEGTLRKLYEDPVYFALKPKMHGKKFEFTYYRPVFNSWKHEFEIFAGLRVLNGDIFSYPTGFERLEQRDRVRYLDLGFVAKDNSYILGLPGKNILIFTFEKGLKSLGAKSAEDLPIVFKNTLLQKQVTLTEPEGRINSSRYMIEANRIQPLNKLGTFLSLKAKAQYAKDVMLLASKFNYGGDDYGLGYKGSIDGDKGYAFLADFYHHFQIGQNYLQYVQLFTSFDYGKVYANKLNLTSANEKKTNASSIAAGVRLGYGNNLYLSAIIAKPLDEIDTSQVNEKRFILKASLGI